MSYTLDMLTFLLFIFVALFFGYIATQNSQPISLTFAHTSLPHVPLFILLGVFFIVGLLFSWIVSLFKSMAAGMKMRGKDNKIKDANTTIQSMTKKVNQLEIENAELKEKLKSERDNTSI